MKLTLSQETYLRTVMDLFEGDPVPGHELASKLDRHPGTIRNRMSDLRSLGLIESTAGPNGGYTPTTEAYETLDHVPITSSAEIGSIRHEGEQLAGTTVEAVKLVNVRHAERCYVGISVRGPVQDVHNDDHVSVGPIPPSGLRIDGVVVGRAATGDVLIVDVERMATATGDSSSPRSERSVTTPGVPDGACDD